VAQTEPCGPVYLSLPREIVYRSLDAISFPTAAELGIPRPAAPDPQGLRELVERLIRARNPMVVAGGGRDPRTVPALVELCELLGLPVVQCAWQSYQSFPFDHPLYQGKRSVAEADVVLVLACDVPWMPGPNAPSADAWCASSTSIRSSTASRPTNSPPTCASPSTAARHHGNHARSRGYNLVGRPRTLCATD